MKKQSNTLLLVAGLGLAGVLLKRQMDAKKAMAAALAAAAATPPAPAPGSMLPGMNGADVLLTAPTGETVAANGQVLGWLGEGYETNDTYDAAPHQYMSRVINDLSGLRGFAGAGSGGGLAPTQGMTAPLKPAVITSASMPSAPAATPGVRVPAATVAASSPAAAGAVAVGASQGYVLVEQYGGNHSIWQKGGQYVTDYTTVPRPGFTLGPFASVVQAEQAIDGGAPPAAAPSAPAMTSTPGAGIPAAQVVANSPAAAGAVAVGAAAGLTLIEQYGGNHSIWNSPTGYVTDYTTVPSPTYTLGPFPSVAAAEQAIDQTGWTLAASTMTQAPSYQGQVIYTMTPTPGAGVVYLVNPPQPANPSTQMPTSGAGFAPSYPTMAAAQAAIDAAVAAQGVPAAANGLAYGGHVIATASPDSPPFTPFYVVDPVQPPAGSMGATITSSPPFAYGGYPTQAAAMAAIDAVNAGQIPSINQAGTTTPVFAQAYGGHTVYTYTPTPGAGAVYLIDYVTGTTPGVGYPTMLAATQAIDAMNATGASAVASSSNPYASDPGTTLSTSDGAYSYDSGASSGATTSDGSTPVQYAQPTAAAAPASGGGTLLALVGAGVVGAGAWFLSK